MINSLALKCNTCQVLGVTIPSGEVDARYRGHDDAVVGLAVLGTHVYSASLDGTV